MERFSVFGVPNDLRRRHGHSGARAEPRERPIRVRRRGQGGPDQCSMDGTIGRSAADEAPWGAIWSRFHRRTDAMHLRQAMQSPQPRCHRQSSAMPREQIRPLRHETSWVRCHEGALRTQRRKAAAGRYEERCGKAAPGTHPSLRDCGPKRKRRPHNADAFA